MNEQKMTLREMGEVIAQSGLLEKKDGTPPTGEEIYNYSTTGELFMIWAWYQVAENLFAVQAVLMNKSELPEPPLILPIPPAETANTEPHAPSTDVSPEVAKHG